MEGNGKWRVLSKKVFPIVPLLEKKGVYVKEGQDLSIFCPFHYDQNHRSARFYSQDNSIYCWSCGKSFYPWDFLIGEMSEVAIIQRIVEVLGDNLELKAEKSSVFEKDITGEKEHYKKGKVDFVDFVDSVYGSLKKRV